MGPGRNSRTPLDAEKVTVRSKTLVIVPQGHIHRLMPSLALEGCVVRFKDEFLPTTSFTVFSQFVGLFHLPLSEGDIRVVDALFKLVKNEFQKMNRHRRTTIAHLLQALISKIEELKLAPLEGKISALKERQRLWEHFNATIERHFRAEHSVTFYARELGITPRKLNEVVKLFLGKGVAEAIDERLVHRGEAADPFFQYEHKRDRFRAWLRGALLFQQGVQEGNRINSQFIQGQNDLRIKLPAIILKLLLY